MATGYRKVRGEDKMPDVQLDERLKKEIWKRDDFTCALCGKMVPWQEVCIVHRKHCDGKDTLDPDDLLTACVYCLEETKNGPPKEKERRRLRRLLRELMEFAEHAEDVIFEEDYEEEVIKLSRKLEELKRDNRMLTDAVQEKEKIAIAYKVKMDRALKDLENLRNRTKTEVDLKVMERTKELFLEMIGSLDTGHASKDRNAEDGWKTDGDDLMSGRQDYVFFGKCILDGLAANGERFTSGCRRFSFHGSSSASVDVSLDHHTGFARRKKRKAAGQCSVHLGQIRSEYYTRAHEKLGGSKSRPGS